MEVEAWRGVDPTPASASGGVSDIPLHVNFPIQKLKIHLNSPAVPGWNEIDAVGLVSTAGEVQWARRVTASSSYGAPPATSGQVATVKALLPAWGGLERFSGEMMNNELQSESRAIDGRGWPLPALWCERDPATGAATAGALGATRQSAVGGSSAGGQSNTNAIVPPSGTLASASGTAAPAMILHPALPIRIAWQGFLVDVAFYVLALAVLRWLFIHPWRLTVEVSRMRHGRCIACGYDLGYDFRAGCPECGWRRNPGDNRADPAIPETNPNK